MKKNALSILLAITLILSVLLCGCGKENDSTTDLSGTYASKNNDGSYQEATITADTIEINWVSDNGSTKSIYWIGTYTAPSDPVTEYTWVSERDKEKTDSALLASTSDTKEFTYKNGVLSYEVSAMGTTTILELTKSN